MHAHFFRSHSLVNTITNYVVAAKIMSFLNLMDLSSFARLNRSTGNLMHRLNKFEKFRREIGVSKKIINLLKKDAEALLQHPLVVANDKERAEVKKSLTDMAKGDFNLEAITVVNRTHFDYSFDHRTIIFGSEEAKKKYQSQLALSNTIVDAGALAQRITPRPRGFLEEIFTSSARKNIDAILHIFALFIVLLGALLSGCGYAWRAIDTCFSKRAHHHVKKRLELFKNLISDEKNNKPM